MNNLEHIDNEHDSDLELPKSNNVNQQTINSNNEELDKPKKPQRVKKPKTEAQQKAWEKALAKRAENRQMRKQLQEEAQQKAQAELEAKILKKAKTLERRKVKQKELLKLNDISDDSDDESYDEYDIPVEKPKLKRQPRQQSKPRQQSNNNTQQQNYSFIPQGPIVQFV